MPFGFSNSGLDEERPRTSWKALTICSPKSIEPSLNHAATAWLSVAIPKLGDLVFGVPDFIGYATSNYASVPDAPLE